MLKEEEMWCTVYLLCVKKNLSVFIIGGYKGTGDTRDIPPVSNFLHKRLVSPPVELAHPCLPNHGFTCGGSRVKYSE